MVKFKYVVRNRILKLIFWIDRFIVSILILFINLISFHNSIMRDLLINIMNDMMLMLIVSEMILISVEQNSVVLENFYSRKFC